LWEPRMCLTNSKGSKSRREEFGTTTTIPENRPTELTGYSGLFPHYGKAELQDVHD
jgi:hypothetical protein